MGGTSAAVPPSPKRVDHNIRTALNDAGNGPDYLVKGLKLPLAMVGRGFDPTLVPEDPAFQRCPYCSCWSVNIVPEDKDVPEKNRRKIYEAEELAKIWNDFEIKRKAAMNAKLPLPDWPTNPFSKNNREMKRAPKAPTAKDLDSPRFICPCVNSSNLQPSNVHDFGNECIAKCRKRPEGDTRHSMELAKDTTLERYEWEGSPLEPTCPSCRCICNKLFYQKDYASIGMALHQKEMRKMMLLGKSSNEEQVGEYMQQAFAAGRLATDDIAAMQQNQGQEMSSELRKSTFYNAAAGYAVRSSSNLDATVVEHMQEEFKRGTKVSLPNDRQHDTRHTTSNKNAHGRNNRIPGARVSSIDMAPGMLDNLNPDYSRVGPKFHAATMNPNNLANSIELMEDSFLSPRPATATVATTAAASATTPAVTLLVYPLLLSQHTVAKVTTGLKELGGDSLGVEGANRKSPPPTPLSTMPMPTGKASRNHNVVITDKDLYTLRPGQKVNDSIVDFWMKW